MSSSPILQQYPAYLAGLPGMVCMMEGKWPHSGYFAVYDSPDLFKTARTIVV